MKLSGPKTFGGRKAGLSAGRESVGFFGSKSGLSSKDTGEKAADELFERLCASYRSSGPPTCAFGKLRAPRDNGSPPMWFAPRAIGRREGMAAGDILHCDFQIPSAEGVSRSG